MRVHHDFFLVPESRSTFPEADPDPDLGQWYGSEYLDFAWHVLFKDSVAMDTVYQLVAQPLQGVCR